jgi:hypothetical protein
VSTLAGISAATLFLVVKIAASGWDLDGPKGHPPRDHEPVSIAVQWVSLSISLSGAITGAVVGALGGFVRPYSFRSAKSGRSSKEQNSPRDDKEKGS